MRKTRVEIVVGLAAVLVLAGCSGEESSAQRSKQSKPGGTLYMLNAGPVESWDPQRMSVAGDISFATRTFTRTLTAFLPAADPKDQFNLVGDLATDTGTAADGGKSWSFTLRDDAIWQDGTPVTCEDVKYGISRTYATGQITGGFTYALAYLDIPKDDKGQSKYLGPYDGTGQDLYDKAVSCSGSTITFHLADPVADFNQALTLPCFAPYRKDQDTGAKGNLQVFSNGPYMIKGSWETNKGATFVRNPHWKRASDPVRKAYPNVIDYAEGMEGTTAIQRIMAGSGQDKYAVTQEVVPPSLQAQIVGSPQLADRSTNPAAPFVDYLAPNFKSDVMRDPKVRQAFAMSTDRGAYVTAGGGPSVLEPTFSILNKNLPAFTDFTPFGTPPNGDPAAARKVLESSGEDLPVGITVTYLKTPTSDKAFAALAEGWEAAGFDVTLDGIAQNYYSAVASPTMATKSDVFWSSWGAAWPSGSTVIPQLFDSRLNLSASSSGADPGYYDNPAINAQMDQAATILDPAQREAAWGKLAEAIASEGGYVALTTEKFLNIHGAGISNYADDGYGRVDLASVAVR
jgi:peptide/nickel transport system substrate-binding protein